MNHRSALKKTFFSIIACVGLLGVLNAAASISSPRNSVFWENPLMMIYPVQGFDPGVTLEKLNSNNRPDRLARFVPDDTRWYRLDPEPTIPNGRLVLNFGDSSTWGWGLSDRDDAYSGSLQSSLPPGTTSVNLGVPAYTSDQGVRYVDAMLPSLSNRVAAVTLYFGNNDGTENGRPDREKIADAGAGVDATLRDFALYRLLRQMRPNGFSSNREPRVSPDDYLANMRAMVATARSYGIPVVVIAPPVPVTWQPGHLNFVTTLEPNVTNAWSLEELQIAKDEHRRGIELIDQQRNAETATRLLTDSVEHDWVVPRIKREWRDRLETLRNISGVTVIELPSVDLQAEYPYNFVDYCHPTPKLHAQIATRVAEAIGQTI